MLYCIFDRKLAERMHKKGSKWLLFGIMRTGGITLGSIGWR